MDPAKLTKLRQISIQNPCDENWDGMEGDEAKRFCAGCGCFVHNLAGLSAEDAEQVLTNPGRVCTRMTVDAKKGILTLDGWIPKLVAAGAIAATVAGCAPDNGYVEQKGGEAINTEITMGKLQTAPSNPQVLMGDVAPPSGSEQKPEKPPTTRPRSYLKKSD